MGYGVSVVRQSGVILEYNTRDATQSEGSALVQSMGGDADSVSASSIGAVYRDELL